MVDEMTSHVTMERKRRSRFDVPPESSFSPSLPTNSFCDVEQGSGDSTSHAHRVPSLQEQTLVALQRQLEYLPQYIPVEDARYRQRLKDALQKNFDYIYRLLLHIEADANSIDYSQSFMTANVERICFRSNFCKQSLVVIYLLVRALKRSCCLTVDTWEAQVITFLPLSFSVCNCAYTINLRNRISTYGSSTKEYRK